MLPTRTLGTEGLTVSCIGLGLMGMSHAYGSPDERDEQEAIATIHRAIELMGRSGTRSCSRAHWPRRATVRAIASSSRRSSVSGSTNRVRSTA
jgi:hypothetical protein